MIDFDIRVRGHRRNIERYCRLLATELTDIARQYLHKQIAEEHAQLERLEKSRADQQADISLVPKAPVNAASTFGTDVPLFFQQRADAVIE
jgi:hypothetical protein